mgnify:CR=1 FL=1
MLGLPKSAYPIDWGRVITHMITLKGIYGREMYETWYKMIALIQSGLDLQPLITHRIGAGDFKAGFAAMRSGEAGKVVMDWG